MAGAKGRKNYRPDGMDGYEEASAVHWNFCSLMDDGRHLCGELQDEHTGKQKEVHSTRAGNGASLKMLSSNLHNVSISACMPSSIVPSLRVQCNQSDGN